VHLNGIDALGLDHFFVCIKSGAVNLICDDTIRNNFFISILDKLIYLKMPGVLYL